MSGRSARLKAEPDPWPGRIAKAGQGRAFIPRPAALAHRFAVLVAAEMLGAKFGLGWYLQFNTAYSAYANVYAALIIMALICAGLVKLLFVIRDRLLGWQKGIL